MKTQKYTLLLRVKGKRNRYVVEVTVKPKMAEVIKARLKERHRIEVISQR